MWAFPKLAAHSFCKPFQLAYNASGYAVGAILLQEDSQEVTHLVVSFLSKKMLNAQVDYATMEELLRIISELESIFVFMKFPKSILSFTLIIALCTTLIVFLSKSQLLTGFSLFLQAYITKAKHVKGVDNALANWLCAKDHIFSFLNRESGITFVLYVITFLP